MTIRPAFLAVLLLAFPTLAENITGPARVIDGDKIEVTGKRIIKAIDEVQSGHANTRPEARGRP